MARRLASPTSKRIKPPPTMGFVAFFEPRSPSQNAVLKAYDCNDILILSGPAGCGKSHAALGAACMEIARTPGKSLILLRPEVEAGPTLGHLPGTVDEKIEPFMEAFKQVLKKIAFRMPPERIQFKALGFARGVTYENSIVIVDEAQNMSWTQLVLLLTRLGPGSKIILCGDPDQTDIRPTIGGYDVDLDAVVDALDGLDRVAVIEFPASASLRHPLISKMLARLNSLRRS